MNIKELAEQAGCNKIDLYDIDKFIDLELFAELVAAAEREACAKLCEELAWNANQFDCAETIRARGTK